MKNFIAYPIVTLLVAGVCQTGIGAELPKGGEDLKQLVRDLSNAGPGVTRVVKEKGAVKRLTIVGQAVIDTSFGLDRGILSAKDGAKTVAKAVFTQWIKEHVQVVEKDADSTRIFMKGDSSSTTKTSGERKILNQKNFESAAVGIISGMELVATRQNKDFFTAIYVWRPERQAKLPHDGLAKEPPANGRFIIKEYTITEEGRNRRDAINKALQEAVESAYGVSIKALLNTSEDRIIKHKRKGDELTKAGELNERIEKKLETFTRGHIHKYEVLNVVSLPEGLVRVKVWIQVAKYNPVGPKSNKRTLAIVPFRAEVNAFPFGNGQIPAANLSKTVNQHLFEHITKSRKFKVLDREFIRERVQEKDFIKREAAPVELAHLHKELGADYLLVGEISEFGVLTRVRDVAGVAISTTTANMVLHYRLLELATGIVHDTATVPVQIPADAVKQMMRTVGPGAVLRAQSDASAAAISGGILEILYPPKVFKSTPDNLVYLDSGGLRMARGQTVRLFDPTLRSLGLAEVVDIFPEFVICRLLGNGPPISIPVGSIARGVPPQSAPVAPRKKPRLKAGDLLGD